MNCAFKLRNTAFSSNRIDAIYYNGDGLGQKWEQKPPQQKPTLTTPPEHSPIHNCRDLRSHRSRVFRVIPSFRGNFSKRHFARDGSSVKSMYCVFRGLGFSSQHPQWMAHNSQLLGNLTLVTSVGTCTYVHILTHTYRHTHNIHTHTYTERELKIKYIFKEPPNYSFVINSIIKKCSAEVYPLLHVMYKYFYSYFVFWIFSVQSLVNPFLQQLHHFSEVLLIY